MVSEGAWIVEKYYFNQNSVVPFDLDFLGLIIQPSFTAAEAWKVKNSGFQIKILTSVFGE